MGSYQRMNLGVQKPVEEWARPGKAEWADTILVELDPRQAIVLLASLARQLEHPPEKLPITLTLVGQLEDIED